VFAELQAKNRRVMYMRDWIEKLDSFLKLADKDVLTNTGKISHELAVERAARSTSCSASSRRYCRLLLSATSRR
jgi:hypothetical protein